MPCNCDGYAEPEPDTHNGPVAEMLCAVMAEHEARGEMSCFSPDQLKWWAEHKRRDAVRIKQDLARAETEKEKQAALEKLTPHERQLLNLT